MSIKIRKARAEDAAVIVRLIQELAETSGEQSSITEEFVTQYFTSPVNRIWLAVEGDQVSGMLSFSIRPDLYHAGPSCLIEELVVSSQARNQGVGSQLVEALISEMKQLGCAEVSVSTMPDNQGAIRFYRRHGFCDEALFLEKHLT